MYKKLFLIALVLIVLIPFHVLAYDENAMTKLWDYNQDSGSITQVAQDEYGLLVCAGSTNGNISCWDSTGVLKWRKRFDSSITKLVISPNGARYVASTIGNFVYYGVANTDGNVQAAYDGYNDTFINFTSGTRERYNVTDTDISRDGAYWGLVTNNHFIVKDSSNITIIERQIDQNSEGGTPSYANGSWTKMVIDPDKGFVVIGTTGDKLLHFRIIDRSLSTWYQGYKYRRLTTFTTGTSLNSGLLENTSIFTITIYNTTGMTTSTTIYTGFNITRPDWRDIRFVNMTDNIAYTYNITGTGSNYAVFDVIFPVLPQASTINLGFYYGNVSASTDVLDRREMLSSNLTFYIPSTTWNWNMEAAGGWTQTLNVVGGNAANVFTLPLAGWHTEGTSALYLASTATGPAINSFSYQWVNSSAVILSGKSNITAGYNGFPTRAYFDVRYKCDRPGPAGPYYGYGYVFTSDNPYSYPFASNCNDPSPPFNWKETNASVVIYNGTIFTLYTNGLDYSGGGLAGFYMEVDNFTFQREIVSGYITIGTWGEVQMYPYDVIHTGIISLTGTLYVIDMPWNTPWVASSTSSTIYNIQVTSAGFGSSFSVAAAAAEPFGVAISDAGSYTIEGRGLITDIYRYGMTKVGTFSAGNNLNSVSVSTSDGLWAVAGSNDGRWYVFSKAGQSTWYLYWASPSGSVVNAVSVDAHGGYVGTGYANGNLSYYSTTPVPVTPSGTLLYITVHVLKDDIPYSNINCTLSSGQFSAGPWQLTKSGLTDTRGNFVFLANPENYYKVTCAPEAASTIIYATNTLTDYYIVIKTQMISGTVDYSAQYSSTTNTIDMRYVDGGLATSAVTFRIINTGNYTEVYNQTFNSNNVAQSWSVPASGMDMTYKVDVVSTRSTGTLHNMWTVRPSGTMTSNLPMDTNMSNVICVIFLMVLAGLFGRVHSARGGLIVVGFFAFFIYKGWMTVPWWAAAPIVVFAFVYALVKAAPQ
jgi:hypothetical protein